MGARRLLIVLTSMNALVVAVLLIHSGWTEFATDGATLA